MFLHRWKINSNRENFYGTLGNRVLSLLISRQRHYHRAKRPDNIDFIKENKLYSRLVMWFIDNKSIQEELCYFISGQKIYVTV